MATSDRGTGIVGYKVRKSVDTKHHLIVVRDATNVGDDRTQLATMAKQAQTTDDPLDQRRASEEYETSSGYR